MEGGEGRVTNPSNLMPISQFNVNRSQSPPPHMMRQKFCFPKHPAFASKPFEELNISRNIALSWCNANSSSIVELDLNLIGLNLNWVQSIYFIIARGPSPPPHLMRYIYRPKALQKICHATQNLFKLQFHCIYNWHTQHVSGVILKSSEEIELFYSGSEHPAPSAEVERIKYCNFILDLVCQNNQMTPFQKECYSTFHQITETAPLLYEVLHIKQKTKKLGPETSFYSF